MRVLVERHPLATVITGRADAVQANHIPLLMSEDSAVLSGHIAQANPLWREANETEALVIFQGLDGYVSPNWYASKQVHGKVVPTWNYCVVHVRGTIRFLHDPDWKLNVLNQLTHEYERKQPLPWSVSDAPADYIDQLLKAIVGLEISIQSMTAKFKLSQNQSNSNYQGVVTGLEQQNTADAEALLEMMQRQKSTQ